MYEPGKFYLEADLTGPTWVWALGDGLPEGVNCLAPIPPKQSFWGDPAASLTMGEMLPTGLIKVEQFRRDARQAMYLNLIKVVGQRGVFNRVPAKSSSAVRFAEEFVRGRVMREVAPSVAEELIGKLPLPIFFIHKRIPLFRDEEQRIDALQLAEELTAITGSLEAAWTRRGWGLGPEDDHGEDHYMRAVLRVIERLDWDWADVADCEPWQRARRFFKGVKFVEQVFGASWITRIVYVKDEVEGLGIEVIALSEMRQAG